MERLNDYESYKEIIQRNRSAYRRGFSNNYLYSDKIKQYINASRLSFAEDESGIQLFIDEKEYYRCILMVNPDAELNIRKLDKPLFLRHIYDITKKTAAAAAAEEKLKANGFSLLDTSVQIVCRPEEREEEYRRNNDKCLKYLDRFGIRIVYADSSYADKVSELRRNTPELKYYQFPYEEASEIKAEFEKGWYRCAFSKDGELIGAQHFIIENGTVQGDWLAVRDEYRVKFGVGRAMAYQSFVYALDNGYDMYYGWVIDTNEASLNYHKGIGYSITNKRADEWALQ